MSLDVSPQFAAYSGVDEDTTYSSGDTSGRVLTINNPWGTQTQADNILASLNSTGFQYQPYRATGAMLDPAAELGDAVTINETYSGIYKMSRSFSSMMSADIEAPQDEEIDHEYPYEPQQDRVYKREIADAKAQITMTNNSITAEVTRATQAEGTLSSRITQNATSINAKVSQTGGSNSSFGWSLLSNKFSLFAGNKEVFKCTSSGVEIQGKITATSGYIGTSSSGFAIGSSSIKNGMNALGDTTNNGIYIGTDGIALGKGKFKVTSSGAIAAQNMTLRGTLNFQNADGTSAGSISAANLQIGASQAYSNYGSWNGTSSYVNSNGSYWTTGAGGGIFFNNATVNGTNTYPNYFTAGYIYAKTFLSCQGSFNFGGSNITKKSAGFYDGNGNYVTLGYLAWY